MTKNDVLNSISLKKRFCKDCNLPITVFDNPYFIERLYTIDPLCNCVEKFDLFCEELEQFSNEQDYFEYYNSVKDSIIDSIKEKPDYIAFNNLTNLAVNTKYCRKNLYTEDNDASTFISIDMKKANFSAMRHYSTAIFEDCDTWEQYVERFTKCNHIINSKYIRQVILGACNPGKQIKYEHYLMGRLLDYIVSEQPSVADMVYSLGEDEILLQVTDNHNISLNTLREIIHNCPDGIGKLVKIEMFVLDKIVGTDGWLKTIYDFANNGTNRVEFKCLNAEIYHQVVKHYYGEPIEDDDLVFYHNGQLAKFLQEVNNPWA